MHSLNLGAPRGVASGRSEGVLPPFRDKRTAVLLTAKIKDRSYVINCGGETHPKVDDEDS